MAEEEQENSNGGSAALLDVNVDIVAVLGVAELRVSQILQLGRGAVVELERKVEIWEKREDGWKILVDFVCVKPEWGL